WSLGIFSAILNHSSYSRIFFGTVIFLGICIFGKEQPHRSFLHSFLGLALLSMAVYILSPLLVPYFAVAMASHIAIDTLNHKRVKLFYPLPGGIRLGLCSADGIVNDWLFKIGSLVVVIEMVLLIGRMGLAFFS
ncbi:MAG TPA: metal-dependent hydrolase, partial [Trichococcus flocculiformis]|nr:metal-dependent hydrolase [Trichococcus flocculiformis]